VARGLLTDEVDSAGLHVGDDSKFLSVEVTPGSEIAVLQHSHRLCPSSHPEG
jgi:hypothetical protein